MAKILRRLVIILVTLAAVFFLIVVPWFLTNIVTKRRFPFRDPNAGKTPQSYGIYYQRIEFHSKDGILLKGWYVPDGPQPRGTIIYCHGRNRSRVEMLPNAVFAHGLGYNGLLFDFRHEGASGGKISTLGYLERLDVLAAIHYALSKEKAARPVILWGVSMGAAAALMAAADSPNVSAVISDSSFLSFSNVIAHYAKFFFGLPKFPIVDEVIYWSAWRGHFWPSEFDLRKAVERINPRPILFVALAGDHNIPPSIARKLYDLSTSSRRRLVILPGSRHGEGFRLDRKQYEEAVRKFLAQVSAPSPREEIPHGSPITTGEKGKLSVR